MFSGISDKQGANKKEVKNSAFKALMEEFLEKGADFDQVKASMKKSAIKCFVKESYPKFLISDGTFFISAYITKEAYDNFKKETEVKESGIKKITDLSNKVIVLS
jgi:thiamine biosynthesis protein ThiC